MTAHDNNCRRRQGENEQLICQIWHKHDVIEEPRIQCWHMFERISSPRMNNINASAQFILRKFNRIVVKKLT